MLKIYTLYLGKNLLEMPLEFTVNTRMVLIRTFIQSFWLPEQVAMYALALACIWILNKTSDLILRHKFKIFIVSWIVTSVKVSCDRSYWRPPVTFQGNTTLVEYSTGPGYAECSMYDNIWVCKAGF